MICVEVNEMPDLMQMKSQDESLNDGNETVNFEPIPGFPSLARLRNR
jgi:hypothetical protein